MYENAGIPAVAFSTTKFGTDTIATFNGWIELLDQIFGGGDKTQGIVDYGNEILTMLRERIRDPYRGRKAQKYHFPWIFCQSTDRCGR